MNSRSLTVLAGLWAALAGCASRTAVPDAWEFREAVVAADHEVASRAGAETLAAGGNAVDAAVATSFTLSVVRPYSCGIGGGGFMIVHLSDEGLERQHALGRDVPRSLALNYREMAPAAITPEYYEKHPDADASTRGGTAVAVPGTVRGLLHAHAKYGELPLERVMAPAIRAAEAGFTVDADYVQETRDLVQGFLEHPDRQERFTFVWRRFLREGRVAEGDLIRLPEQAEALKLIARDGAAAFTSGPIAVAVDETVRRDGGLVTRADLEAFRVVEFEPLRFRSMERTFLTMPPPSSGGVALAEALGILGHLDVWRRGIGGAVLWPPGAETYRDVFLTTEALKHAFADRAEWLADPAFTEVPVERLISAAYTASLASRVNMYSTQDPAEYGSRRRSSDAPEDGGTSHFCVVDRTGSAVSCTETINLEFGSLLAVERFGFCLNNQMDDFTTRRGLPNAFGLAQADRNLPEPGKRPLSSMTPTIVLDGMGRVDIVLGASGGPRIISSTLQVLLGAMVAGEDGSRTPAPFLVAAPRFHHQWSPDILYPERSWYEAEAAPASSSGEEPALVGRLERAGFTVRPRDEIGTVQLIRRAADGRGWEAACDPRKGGKPAGPVAREPSRRAVTSPARPRSMPGRAHGRRATGRRAGIRPGHRTRPFRS